MTKDGTQDPGPPPVLTDPVSGLVTGSRYEPEPLKVRVVEPPMPDISAVREAMVGMLDDDSELSLGLAAQRGLAAGDAQTGEIPVQSTGEPTPTPPIGIPVQQTSSPAEPPPAAAPLPAPAAPAEPATPPADGRVRRMPPPPVNARVITPGTVERTRRLPSKIRRIRRARPERPAAAMGRKSSAPSLAVIVVLLLVIGVIVIVLIASLIDTISSIFG